MLCMISGSKAADTDLTLPDSLLHLPERHLIVKGDQYYPPFEFINQNGEPDGFNVELFKAMAEMLGLKYTIQLGPWKQVRAELEDGSCDVLLGLMISDERAVRMLFGTPHSVMTHGIFARKGTHYKNLEALRNKAVVVQDRDLMHDMLLQTGLTQEIITTETQLEALRLIASGKHDAALIGNFQGEKLLKEARIQNVYMTTGQIEPVKYAMAVGKEDHELIWLLNMGLYQLKASGQYQELYDKWFGVYESRNFFRTYKLYIFLVGAALFIMALFIMILRIKVNSATRHLVAAKARAEESDRLKTAFLNNISHEIRTPLNGILGFTELMFNEPEESGTKRNYHHMVKQCSQRLLDTMEDILAIARIEAGQEAATYAWFNLTELFTELENSWKAAASKAGNTLNFSLEIPPHQQQILTDRHKLSQILSKLLNNAIKFTQNGSISVTCNIEEQQLHLAVADTGIGIPQESIGYIFERFRQVTTADHRNHDGVGLGLPIAKAYTDMLGGKIRVESSPGVGTIFHLHIPCTFAENQNITVMDPKPGATPSTTRHFIIAEDDEINFQLLETILRLSFNDPVIHHAMDGRSALKILEEDPMVNVILMDLKMPVMDGYEATKQIKQSHPEIMVIAITAYAMVHDKEKALASGCDSYVSKPLLKADLIQALTRLNIIPDKN